MSSPSRYDPTTPPAAARLGRDFRDSELAGLLQTFQHVVQALPGREPLLMADVDPADEHRVLAISAHCPSCGGTSLAEMDWDVRWNHLHDFEFSPYVPDRICARVALGDIEHETLTWFCTDCGQVLDLAAVHLDWI